MNTLRIVNPRERDVEGIIEQYWKETVGEAQRTKTVLDNLKKDWHREHPGILGIVDQVKLNQQARGASTFYIPTCIYKERVPYEVPNIIGPVLFTGFLLGLTLVSMTPGVTSLLERRGERKTALADTPSSPPPENAFIRYLIPTNDGGNPTHPIPFPDPRGYHVVMSILEKHPPFIEARMSLSGVADSIEKGMKITREVYSGGNVVPVFYTLPLQKIAELAPRKTNALTPDALHTIATTLCQRYGYTCANGS